jgi:hypothetical protein
MELKDLVKKWEKVLNEGKEIKNPKIKKSTALMLENQHTYLTEAGSYTQTGLTRQGAGYEESGDFHKIAVPMVRRTFPELIAHEIVGVQPMTGPVGLAFALRFKAGTSQGNYVAGTTELGYNTIDRTYSGSYVTSAGEQLGSDVTRDRGLGIGSGEGIREVNMTVEKAQVEAGTRKLRSRWSLEVAQDLRAMHGLDLEEEMMDILAYEITQEIDRELIYTIKSSATYSTATSANWDFSSATGRWEAEKYRELYNALIRKSNIIAVNTRRGAGNFVVVNPTVAAVLETLSSFTIQPVPSDVGTQVTGVARLGSLDGRIAVYRDTFSDTDEMIIGYKGPSEYDAGVIYLPYVQLLAMKATFEDSFHPTVGLMSRYAIYGGGPTVGSPDLLFESQMYYYYIKVNNLP